MQIGRECCPICVRIPELSYPSFYGSLERHQVRRDVPQRFNRPFGNLPGFENRRVTHQKTFSGVPLLYWPHLFSVRVPPSCGEHVVWTVCNVAET